MKRHIAQYLPRHFFDIPAVWHAFLLGMVYLLLLLTQLFTFEDFPAVIATWGLRGGLLTAGFLAGIIPLLEAASLPFLISMNVSENILRVSKYAAVAVGVVWSLIALWLVFSMSIAESGLFGATISLPAGVWMLVYGVLLLTGSLIVVTEKRS